jgi:hypothetical protein
VTDDEPDFLDEFIARQAKKNPDFPKLVEEAARKREELAGEIRELLDES